MSSGNIVQLDIGGLVFKTSKSTLTKFDGFFKTMFETNTSIATDKFGCVFIDRSPKHFNLILNFMRDGKAELPDCDRKLREIQNEAQYYLITGLDKLCEEKLQEIARLNAPFDEEVQILNTHSELIQVIAEPKKPVLIIYYHVDLYGRTVTPKEFFIKYFLNRYKQKMNIFFKAYTQTTWPLSNDPTFWVWSLHYKTDWSYSGMTKDGESWPMSLKKGISDFFTTNSLAL